MVKYYEKDFIVHLVIVAMIIMVLAISSGAYFTIKKSKAHHLQIWDVTTKKLLYNQYPVTFRAIYDSDNVQIANTVGFNFDQSPAAETSGCLYDKQKNTHTIDANLIQVVILYGRAITISYYHGISI